MLKSWLIAIVASAIPVLTQAETFLKATDLQLLCAELHKSEVGSAFDQNAASKCQGYLAGFFDSMVVLERLRKSPYFCIPSSVPKQTNTRILDQWIAANKKIASDTTATVALLSAYHQAFPCEAPRKK